VKSQFPKLNQIVPFGHRRGAPRVCVVDGKPHIRLFLSSTLEELGFVTHQCGRVLEATEALSSFTPDVVLIGHLTPEYGISDTIRALATMRFRGKVMLFGGRASLTLMALHELGENMGLSMLPPLLTPFRDSDLQKNLASFLPIRLSPNVEVDVGEALGKGWLEVWYQPNIDLRLMSLRGAEAALRLRHPSWGILAPSQLAPSDSDPRFQGLAEFVRARTMTDWTTFATARPPIEFTINFPLAALESSEFIEQLCRELPRQSVSARLLVGINSAEVGRDPALARRVAKQLTAHNVGVSIDDVIGDVSWAEIPDFPIAELRVDQVFIDGCASDQQKRSACGTVLQIAEQMKARTIATGIESSEDFQAVCDMGFTLGQGSLFAKPMEAGAFARTMLKQRH
jgi:EAL domain-containing protein (putative c-di-GMP-specific phosphodiesterase class I)/CheY-like chemotaxis protein